MIIYPEISFTFHRQRHPRVLSQGMVHLYTQQPKQIKERKIQYINLPRFVHDQKERISYVVEETYPGRDADLLFDPESVPRIRIEVYRYIYFGFVGYSLDLCRSWGH